MCSVYIAAPKLYEKPSPVVVVPILQHFREPSWMRKHHIQEAANHLDVFLAESEDLAERERGSFNVARSVLDEL